MTRGAARTRLSASWVLVRLLVICGIVWLPACSALESIPLPFLAATTPTSLPSDATPTPDETIRVTDTPTPLPPDELALWLPPEFDPASGSRAGDLLQARIAAFEEANDIRVSVRIKSATGAGGLLAALSAASAAAPLSLPGVIALPRTEFESAAIKGFLLPLEGLSPALNEEDWFGYARELALVEGVPFGLPFAGDALALVYRPSQVNGSLVTWDNILEQGQPLGIAVGSPLGFSTLVFYGSVGGQFEDAQRRPMLQVDPLTTVLEFYRLGASRGLFRPGWPTSPLRSWSGRHIRTRRSTPVWCGPPISCKMGYPTASSVHCLRWESANRPWQAVGFGRLPIHYPKGKRSASRWWNGSPMWNLSRSGVKHPVFCPPDRYRCRAGRTRHSEQF